MSWPQSDRSYIACVIFIDRTNACNYWSTVNAGRWTNLATSVRDGTRFRVLAVWDTRQYYRAMGRMEF
ncbi:hypothetical protein [Plantactinospora sp. CA-290183]|uniref:hypothetical protein n=1 Tax=Plantactinospora sp. CA-290183 TaxID=3240006 RepID=UPI003D8CF88D